jgi:hypothetical protein
MIQLQARDPNGMYRLLGEIHDLPRLDTGTCVEKTWDRMDEIIEYLDSDAPNETAHGRKLREEA